MPTLVDVQRQADTLSSEERVGLIAYLVHSLPGAPLGPDDDELHRREAELDSGKVQPLTHEEFLREVGRG
jgi:putative addiction module component (TIGR02574 family)